MWPFKPKRIGFTDKDGVYKIKLNKKAWLSNYEHNLQFCYADGYERREAWTGWHQCRRTE
jgi:hypothetical protein